ncbi:hypothetical protein Pla123a_02640 [Posidoniimonas polymericola]|uniref:Uncharacterized protein n=1 Tax=Posidoniimonas polymericola TaxID=2528002 RepID=A0A5C5ZEH1_9BACT|nr:hypothetical protein [Posidoniimonas polymericola]TWT85457.1 hypothetical protein Pla123a_02640 [Posidoniimonas polymericola]
MRLIAISIVVLAGVLGSAVGVVAQAFSPRGLGNDLDVFGAVLAAGAAVLFLLEWWASRPE